LEPNAPATVSVPTALVAAAAAGRAEAGKAASDVTTAAAASVLTALEDDGELLGSMFDLLSSICRMSACRFVAQTATFCVVSATCRRHVSVMSQTQENVVSARVSKRHDI